MQKRFLPGPKYRSGFFDAYFERMIITDRISFTIKGDFSACSSQSDFANSHCSSRQPHPMQRKSGSGPDLVRPRPLSTLLVCAVVSSITAGTLLAFLRFEASSKVSPRTLTFAERVAYQRAIEEVYWRHRIWPKERPDPKPPFDVVMSQPQIEKKVEDYLRDSQALKNYWQKPITSEQLQAEMDRMARHSRQPEVLRELFAALGNDPFVIAECLARPVLTERLSVGFAAGRQLEQTRRIYSQIVADTGNYILPSISDAATGCTPDTWTATSTTNAPAARTHHTAVWTGSEMIVWGGNLVPLNTGGRYNPTTDSWAATSTTNAPDARYAHTAVWTGTEMIIWGGIFGFPPPNTGGRYNPSTDTWIATSTTNAPEGRFGHTAVWTGNEMIVWGGSNGSELNSGGRYNPSTNSWTATSNSNAPTARTVHTAVWTSGEMIVWGGYDGVNPLNTGGKYNPSSNTWTATSTANAPTLRSGHTAVWTDNEMIIWGGNDNTQDLNTGGRYNPGSDSWTATNISNAPTARELHTAVWTNSEMIVWGGIGVSYFNTGGRYDPDSDSWTATSTTDAPTARVFHTAVWSGSEMIIWGGETTPTVFINTGGRYCAQPGAAPTPTPRATPTPRPRPTPAPRP